jgi:hypothetical protein
MHKMFLSAHWKRKDSVLRSTGKIMKLVNFVGASLLVVFAGCGTLPVDNENGERIYASYPGHLRAIRDAINHPAAGKR